MGRKLPCQTQQRDGVEPATLELPRSIRMDDWMDGQRTDDEMHGFRGGFISHPDVLYYIYIYIYDIWNSIIFTLHLMLNILKF